eukprot:183912-Pleurochrysis_carterae.AAC.1
MTPPSAGAPVAGCCAAVPKSSTRAPVAAAAARAARAASRAAVRRRISNERGDSPPTPSVGAVSRVVRGGVPPPSRCRRAPAVAGPCVRAGLSGARLAASSASARAAIAP